jgi:hypothetical protein
METENTGEALGDLVRAMAEVRTPAQEMADKKINPGDWCICRSETTEMIVRYDGVFDAEFVTVSSYVHLTDTESAGLTNVHPHALIPTHVNNYWSPLFETAKNLQADRELRLLTPEQQEKYFEEKAADNVPDEI